MHSDYILHSDVDSLINIPLLLMQKIVNCRAEGLSCYTICSVNLTGLLIEFTPSRK